EDGIRDLIVTGVQTCALPISLTPIQAGAIAPALDDKDVIGTSQTGSGKTLAFLIPMIEMLQREASHETRHQTRALVLLPTRELRSEERRVGKEWRSRWAAWRE